MASWGFNPQKIRKFHGMFFTMKQMGISLINIDWFMMSSTQYLGFTIGIPSKPAIGRNCPIDVFTLFMYLYSTYIDHQASSLELFSKFALNMFGTVAANQVLCLDVHHNCRALSTFDKLPMDVPMKATPPIYNPTAHPKLCSKNTYCEQKNTNHGSLESQYDGGWCPTICWFRHV